MRRLLPIIVLIAVIAAGAYVGFVRARRMQVRTENALVASFLDEGLGNAIVLETPEKRFAVVDPGPEITAQGLVDYLRQIGARSLDVVITSAVPEHTGALQALVDSFQVRRVIHGGIPWREPPKGPKGPVDELVLSEGDSLRLSPKVRLDVLSPPKAEIAGETSRPLITRVTFGETRFLLMSDAAIEDEAYLIRSGADLTSTVLVVPNHGRAGSTSLEMLSIVRPQYCVVLAGVGADRPSRAVLDRIKTENTGAAVYRTDRHGVIDLVSDGRSILAQTERSER